MRIDGARIYPGQSAQFDRDVRQCLEMAAEELRRDLRDSHTLPWAEDSDENRRRGVVPGMLSQETYVDRTQSNQGKVSVVSDTPYARRLYYHPEFRFYRGTNEAAGGLWFEPYKKGGAKEGFFADRFGKFMRRRRG